MSAPVRQARYSTAAVVQVPRLQEREGRILVHLGDYVSSDTILADEPVAVSHKVIDVGRMLGMSREIPTADFVDWKVGEQIEKDDILAQRGSMFKGVIRSPVSGKIVAIGGGQVMIEVESPRRDLVAGMPGLVRQIVPERGVILELNGAVVDGIWGNNRMGFGVLHMLANEPLRQTVELQLALQNRIVVTGSIQDAETFRWLAASGVKGIISGGVSSRLLGEINAWPYPLMLVDGFGAQAMNSTAYRVLESVATMPCYLLALPYHHHLQQQPVALVQRQLENFDQPVEETFAVGQQVKVISRPYLGQMGTIIEIDPSAYLHYAGKVPVALLRFDDESLVQIPLQNLEIISSREQDN